MDKQSLPLIILCLLLLFFWQHILDFIWPPPPRPPGWSATNQVAAVTHSATSQVARAEAKTPTDQGEILSRAGPAVNRDAEKAVLDNDLVRVEFTSQGGGVDRIVLKKFAEGKSSVELNAASPLPVMATAVDGVPYRAPYRLTSDAQGVTATTTSSEGLAITKEYAFQGDYLIRATVTLRNTSPNVLTNQVLHVATGLAAPMNAADNGEYVGMSALVGEKPVHHVVSDLVKHSYSGPSPVHWVAARNQYFTLLVTPSIPFASVRAESLALPEVSVARAVKKPQGALTVASGAPLELKPGASTNYTFQIFAGPKEYQRLEKLGQRQDLVLDFGMWEIFCKALLWLLAIFNGFFGNWGVAIIGVTVVVKIIFWPLTAISTKSMKQMQALAPKMNALKEKYANDPKKMNEEVMKMYREYRINPMAGCLPMLIQIPIFFAFYKILQIAIELRGAPFCLWITDLSQPDTIAQVLGFNVNVMPLLMAVTMIWNTLITPQSPNTDPSMKMMMWLMPAMFLWFCYNFSSGLSLYWTVQNLLTILQTYLTRNQTVEPPQKVKARRGFSFARPPASRK